MSRPRSSDSLETLGSGLQRPECVVVDRDNAVYVPDWRGGVTRIAADGSQQTWLAAKPPVELRPNGIELLADGSFLLANLSDVGGVRNSIATGRSRRFSPKSMAYPSHP